MKQATFERALHQWPPWLDSIAKGRQILRLREPRPSLEEMREVAKQFLATRLDFPECTAFELYWLCCVFADYDSKSDFRFDSLVLPGWFPLPFGFRREEDLAIDLKVERIKPPTVWNEADRMFWFIREPLTQICPPEKRLELFKKFPEHDFVVVLPSNHPMRDFVSYGRPRNAPPHAEISLPHEPLLPVTDTATAAADQFERRHSPRRPPMKCTRCGGTALWDRENALYLCILCGREMAEHGEESSLCRSPSPY
jgi:ribosomal protein S14